MDKEAYKFRPEIIKSVDFAMFLAGMWRRYAQRYKQNERYYSKVLGLPSKQFCIEMARKYHEWIRSNAS